MSFSICMMTKSTRSFIIEPTMAADGELFFIESILDQFFSQGALLDKIDVLNAFNLIVPVNWKIEERKLDHFLFSVISGGRGQLIIDGREHCIGPGSIYLIAPGKKHSIYTAAESPLKLKSIHFSIADVVVEPQFIFRTLLWNETVQFDDVLNQCSSVTNVHFDRYQSYTFKNSVIGILLMCRNSLSKPSNREYGLISKIDDLEKSETMTVKELANACGYTEKAFIRAFRKMYGTTPHQYLIKTKIFRAEYLVLYSDFSIKEIASCLGYKDQYIFSKQFKKYTGDSPLRYRDKFH